MVPARAIVSASGHPESKNYKNPIVLLQQGYCITLFQEKYLIIGVFNRIPFFSLALALTK